MKKFILERHIYENIIYQSPSPYHFYFNCFKYHLWNTKQKINFINLKTQKTITMKVKSKIELEFKTPEDAKIIFKTLEVDNENFLNSKIESTTITYEIDNESLTTTLATIDDLIACEILSEKITSINE